MEAKSPEEEHPKQAFGWAARDQSGLLSPFKFSRRYSSLIVHDLRFTLHTLILLKCINI
jgi:hypothetical protein